jgi:hypothetical protein
VRVLWEDRALADLEAIADRAPRAAAHLYEAVRWLSRQRFPAAFRRLAVDRPEYVLSVPPYIVIYRVDGDDLSVLALEDARQRREEW